MNVSFQGETLDDIPQVVLEDCAQLVKANSIQGIIRLIRWLCGIGFGITIADSVVIHFLQKLH